MINKFFKTFATYIGLTVILNMIFESYFDTNNVFVFSFVNVLIYCIIIFVIFFIHRSELKEMLFDYKNIWNKNIKKNLITWVIGFIFMMIFNYIILKLLPGQLNSNEVMVRELYEKYIISSILINAFLAPVLEELVFRLGLNLINNKYIYFIVSSLIFGFFHTFGSIKELVDILYILPYFSLGMAFAIVYRRSENILDSIIIHSLHNIVTLILYFIFL